MNSTLAPHEIDMPRVKVIPDGEKTLRARAERGLTQQEVAEKSGYDKRTIERIEKGDPTTLETLSNIAEVLSVDVTILLNGQAAKLNEKELANCPASEDIATACEIELVIDREFNSFTSEEADSLVRALYELCQIERRIVITQKRPGSVVLRLRLESADAERIRTAFASGILKRLGVVELRESPGLSLAGRTSDHRPIPMSSGFLDQEPSELIRGIRNGDRAALEQVFLRYYNDLVRYGRSRMERNRQSAADGEDAAISAMRAFVRRAGDGEPNALDNQTAVYRLLCVIVLRKSIKFQLKDKRFIHISKLEGDESSSSGGAFRAIEPQDPGTDIVDAMIVQETLDQLLEGLSSTTSRRIALMQLEGYPNPYIAHELDVSVRTIERHQSIIRNVLSSIEAYERNNE